MRTNKQTAIEKKLSYKADNNMGFEIVGKKVDVLMAEMTAVRNEINTTKETIHSILNFFFILISAEISLFVSVWDSVFTLTNPLIRLFILLIPILFFCLSIYHSECVMRIHTYITYVDSTIRNKIGTLLGDPLLNNQSKFPTKTVFGVFHKSPMAAKLGYLSKLGIKIISMLLPILFYIYTIRSNCMPMSIYEWILLPVDIVLTISLFFMQHD